MNPAGKTLGDVFEVFCLFRQAEGLSPRTFEWYRHIMNTLFHSPLGIKRSTPIAGIGDEDLYRHIASLSVGGHGGKRLQASSVNGHTRALKAFFNWCHREKYTGERLLENFRPPKPDHKEIEVLNDAEIARLLIVTKNDPRGLALVTTMLDSGLRITEAAEARLSGLDFEAGTLKVRGKGRKERLVLLGVRTRKYLIKYLRSAEEYRLPGNDRIFISIHGAPLTKNGLSLFFARLKKRTGITRLHAHLLRHTFATRYLQSGGNTLALKQLLGHSSLKMVDRYVHIASAEAIRASAGLSLLDRIASGRPVTNDMGRINSREGVVAWTGSGQYDDRD
jgi:integrase/recombinase XerC/integrase/recombinase XerD